MRESLRAAGFTGRRATRNPPLVTTPMPLFPPDPADATSNTSADAASDLLPGMPYRHYKGGAYRIVGLGRIEADLSQVVVYEAMRDRSQLWVRPLDVFLEPVETPQGSQLRFAPDWPAALACLDFLPRAAVLQALACYDAPYRHYHDRRHVLEMFEVAHSRGIALTPAQALAVLLHDAVYVPGCEHNEAASAAWIPTLAAGTDAGTLAMAARIVLDTRAHVPSLLEAEVVLDLDLDRLAAPAEAFAAYTAAVFEENRAVLAAQCGLEGEALYDAFLRRRIAFLQALAERERLFLTPAFADCEAPARKNIAGLAAAV